MGELARFQVPQRDGAVVAGGQRQPRSRHEGNGIDGAVMIVEAREAARLLGGHVPDHHGVVEGACERASRSGVDSEGLDGPAMADEVAGAGAPLLVRGAAVGFCRGIRRRGLRPKRASRCHGYRQREADSGKTPVVSPSNHAGHPLGASFDKLRTSVGSPASCVGCHHSAGAMRAAAVSAAATSSIFSISRSAHRLWCSLAQLTST